MLARPERFATVAGATSVLWLGCVKSLDDRPCPCIAQQVCCEATNRCEPAACSEDLALRSSEPDPPREPGEPPGGDASTLADAGPDAAPMSDAAQPPSPAVVPRVSLLGRRLPRYCNLYGWCGEPNRFDAVWGSAADDVWVVGNDTQGHGVREASTFLHWNGELWQTIPNAVLSTHTFRAIAGVARDDLWFVGMSQDGGAALRWQGGAWSGAWLVPGTTDLRAAWANTGDDVWAVGAGGSVAHWDGASWSALPTSFAGDLNGIWGSTAEEIWIVGTNGTLLRRAGASFSAVPPPAEAAGADFNAVWGSDPNDVWAVGAAGVVLHYDGASWSRSDLDAAIAPDTALNAVFGAGPSDVWVASGDGALLHWNGMVWSAAPVRAAEPLLAVWAEPGGKVWAVGAESNAVHHTGSEWWQSDPPLSADLFGVWGTDSTNIWAVGTEGTLAHFDGSAWATEGSPVASTVRAIHGTSASDIWAVGDQILHYDGQAWSSVHDSAAEPLKAVWASAPDQAWAVGSSGVVLHWDGREWSADHPFADRGLELDLHQLFGTSATDVWVLSTDGLLFHWDGATWDQDLGAGAGLGLNVTLSAPVLGGSSSEDLWVSGTFQSTQGSTWLYQKLRTGAGVDWTRPDPTQWYGSVRAALSRGPRDLWLCGSSLWQVTGGVPNAFPEYSGLAHELNALWSASPTDVWAVGNAGTILHKEELVLAEYELGI